MFRRAGGQFFGEIFLIGPDPEETQCFTGDRAFRVESFGQFWGGFIGLRRMAWAVWKVGERFQASLVCRPERSEYGSDWDDGTRCVAWHDSHNGALLGLGSQATVRGWLSHRRQPVARRTPCCWRGLVLWAPRRGAGHRISDSMFKRGGSAWESNPPETVRTAPHQF